MIDSMSRLENIIRLGIDEIKFLKSFKDIKIFYDQKLPFIMPRATGWINKKARVPLYLKIEPTNNCNLQCICCSRGHLKRDTGYMEMDLFRKIIDDAASISVKRVHLYLHGEPLLHPQIVEMIRYVKLKGLAITLATNGMPMNKKKIEDILHSGVDSADYFRFSILGYSKGIHEAIMKGVNHQKVLDNINTFLKCRKRLKVNGPVIETIFHRMPENEAEESDFIKYWRGIVDHVHFVSTISEQFNDSCEDKASPPMRTTTCNYIWEQITIFWNGDTTTCMADLNGDHMLGNLVEKSIREIWNCKELSAIRELHRRRRFQDQALCSTCDW